MTEPRTAFITGASSGIGAAFARRCARDGYDLVLHGRREVLLAALCAELAEAHGVRAEYILGELSSGPGLDAVESRLRSTTSLHLLVNNAGSTTTGLFHEEPIEGQIAMIQTHVVAAVRLTHAALPALRRRGDGAIINVSSVASFTPGRRSVTYCSAKAYLTTFSEALHLEVAVDGVRVQALCPGYTTTDFHSRIGIDIPPALRRHFMSPDDVVDASFRDLARGRVVSVPGWKYRGVARIVRYIPKGVYYRLALAAGRRTEAMRRREAAEA